MKLGHPFELSIYDKDKKLYIPLEAIPQNAVENLDKKGLPKVTSFNLPSLVKMNVEGIIQAIDDCKNSPLYIPESWVRYEHMPTLDAIKKALNNTLAPNLYVQLYSEGENGRLYPPININYPNIITMSKEVRGLVFSDMGLYDYDISNCHFTIFAGLCERVKFDCPIIRDYIEHKSKRRKE